MTIIRREQIPRLSKGLHKYHAKRTRCIYGHNHPSKLEAYVCNVLLWRAKNKKIKGYEYQPKYPLYVKKKLICMHYPDFRVCNNNNSEEIWEAKGIIRPVWRVKKKLFEALHPNILYRIITKETKL